MSDWVLGLVTWWNRRQRFTEEWTFHLEAAAAELEMLGFTRRDAQRAAKRRLGSTLSYRRKSLRAIGGDFAGLLGLLPTKRAARSPLLPPSMLLIGAGLALVFNPARLMALKCLEAMLNLGVQPPSERLIPLTPAGLVPVDFVGFALRILLVCGLARIALDLFPRTSLRLSVYATAVLFGVTFAAAVCWITFLQALVARSWAHDGVQGIVLIAFVFGFTGTVYKAMRLWWVDVERRCPVCLRLPGMPEPRGKQHDILVEPLEVESICFHGHGLISESRWSRRFTPGEQLFPQ